MLDRFVVVLALSLATAFPVPGHAVDVSLVIDLHQGPVDYRSNIPSGFMAAGSRTVFSAMSGQGGFRTWVSDGTAAGTDVLADFCSSAACGSYLLGSVGGHAILVSTDGQASGLLIETIWSTSGTAGDAVPLMSGVTLAGYLFGPASPAYLVTTAVGAGGAPEARLWRTDGTLLGTQVVSVFKPAEVAEEWLITNLGNRLILSGRDESWGWDGTSAGARLLPVTIDINLGFASFKQGAVFWGVGHAQGQAGLWQSDGTPEGTRLITANAGQTLAFAVLGELVYFVQDDPTYGQQLWMSDGSAGGTRRLSNYTFPQAFDDLSSNYRRLLFPMADRVLFLIDDGHGAHAFSWWKPGLTAPRRLLGCAGGCPAHVDTTHIETIGQRIVFLDNVDGHTLKTYVTDGTAAGTRRLGVSVDAAVAYSRLVVGDKLFFRAGSSIWVTDGTRPGTRSLLAIDAPIFWVGLSGSEWWIGLPNQVWRTDGTAAGTTLVKSPLLYSNESSDVVVLADVGSAILFCDGSQLYGLQGSGAPEALTSSPLSCSDQIQAPELGEVFFRIFDSNGLRWWGSDGTPAGTTLLEPPAGYDGSALLDLAHWNGVTLAAYGGQGLAQFFLLATSGWVPLFRADSAAIDFVPQHLTGSDLLYFDATGLWRMESGGTSAQLIGPRGAFWSADLGSSTVIYSGVYQRCTFAGGCTTLAPLAGQPQGWLTSGGRLFVVAAGATDNIASLWRIDPDGTVERLPANCGPAGPPDAAASQLTELSGRILMACGPLWVSDGTAGGTALLLGGQADGPFVAGGPLSTLGGVELFSAYDIEHGEELWQTDGTPAGTRLLQDIDPGPGSSSPAGFLSSNGLVYFTAWDPVHGRELRVAKP